MPGLTLAAVIGFCAPAGHGFAIRGGLLWGVFLAACGGSITHCAPMCGPLVLAQTADQFAAVPASQLSEKRRLLTGLLLPYHFGRILTYSFLGALCGAISRGLNASPTLALARPLFLAAAALLFLGFALRATIPRFAHLMPQHAPGFMVKAVMRVTSHLPRKGWLSTFALGLALGFLPCGLVYAALAAALTSPTPLWGAATMLVFGLGTAPILAIIGIAGRHRPVAKALATLAPLALTLNAIFLTVLAIGSLPKNW